MRLFRIKASESLGKSLVGAITKKKNGQTRTKKAIDLRVPKLPENFTTVAMVCHRYERLAVLQNVFAIILL